jgi:aryl-alcohol dehydrogenase-like predicted oxidoreductase
MPTRATRPFPTPAPPGAPLLTGHATAAGTRRFAERFAGDFVGDFFRPLGAASREALREAGRAGARHRALTVSSIGIGTYLGDCDAGHDAAYEGAVGRALALGVNLVDTAINYRCQRSERAVGAALASAVAEGVVARDEVVLCSKAGYIALDGAPPPTRDDYRAFLEREYFAPGVMAPDDVVAGGHCLAPGFIAHQIDRSRANLRVTAVDLHYLHNPEQQLEVLEPAAFRSRIRDAFALLEERVARGEVGRYGCATWGGLRAPPRTRGHLSLSELVEVAREVAGDGHHLAAVQLPVNLAMPEVVRSATQELRVSRGATRTVPLLEAAAELGIAVVGCATLMQGQLAQGLPEQLRAAFPGLATDAQRAIAFSRALPGVAAALVGMKRVEHVEENLEGVHARAARSQ